MPGYKWYDQRLSGFATNHRGLRTTKRVTTPGEQASATPERTMGFDAAQAWGHRSTTYADTQDSQYSFITYQDRNTSKALGDIKCTDTTDEGKLRYAGVILPEKKCDMPPR